MWRSQTRNDLTVEVIPQAPASFNDDALAMAMPYTDSGVRIVIFYNRLDRVLRGHGAPQEAILGYVLAHEIAHVLQGDQRHSKTGIMRAHWTDNDFKQMGIRVLTFTPEDVQVIRQYLAHPDVGPLFVAAEGPAQKLTRNHLKSLLP
jgi:hypothetical protein